MKPLGMLVSYHYFRKVEPEDLNLSIPLLIDSGAFSALNMGFEITPEEYGGWLAKFEGLYEFAINMDVIYAPKLSFDNWMKLNRMGISTMPVIHYLGDPAEIIPWYMESGYPVPRFSIAGGGLFGYTARLDLLKWQAHTMRYLHTNYPDVLIHGLGIHASSPLARLPWDTTDASTFAEPWRFGLIRLYNPQAMRWHKVDSSLNGKKDATYKTIYTQSSLLRRTYGLDVQTIIDDTSRTGTKLQLCADVEHLQSVQHNLRLRAAGNTRGLTRFLSGPDMPMIDVINEHTTVTRSADYWENKLTTWGLNPLERKA